MCHGFTKLAQAAANEWPALAFEIFALDGMCIRAQEHHFREVQVQNQKILVHGFHVDRHFQLATSSRSAPRSSRHIFDRESPVIPGQGEVRGGNNQNVADHVGVKIAKNLSRPKVIEFE